MPVKFLSEEWSEEVKQRLNESEGFKSTSGGSSARLQQIILSEDGERRYWVKIGDGEVDMGIGDIEDPDVTITQDYETAVAMARSELSPVTAFMSGKLKVGGNMMLLMQLQGAFSELPRVMQEMDVDY